MRTVAGGSGGFVLAGDAFGQHRLDGDEPVREAVSINERSVMRIMQRSDGQWLSITRTYYHLSLRGTPAHPELVEGRGNLDEVEHRSANRRCYDDEIATLRSQ